MTEGNINKVEGFDPMQYARKIGDGNGNEVLYLDVQYRKLWFRLCNPTGKIVKKICTFDGNIAVVEARVYLDRNDPAEAFVSNAFAQRICDPSNIEYGNRYLENAETAAVGRALADAGYGLQFCIEADPTPVDMGQRIPQPQQVSSPQPPVPSQNTVSQSIPAQRQSTAQQRQVQPNTPPQRQAITSQPQQVSSPQPPVPSQSIPAQRQTTAQQRQVQPNTPPQPQQTQQQNTPPQPQQTQQQQRVFTHQTPLEVILKEMTYDEAVKVVYRCNGSLDGKTMGQIAAENFGYLQWLAEKCNTPKNLFKGAAQIIVREHLTRKE